MPNKLQESKYELKPPDAIRKENSLPVMDLIGLRSKSTLGDLRRGTTAFS